MEDLPATYDDVTPVMMASKIAFLATKKLSTHALMLHENDPKIPFLEFEQLVLNELDVWHAAMTKDVDPECDHPTDSLEATRHKGAVVVLCAKCNCFCLSDQDVWEPYEETLYAGKKE